ncbi:MAG: PadR family transcriptional regulator [Deltaproteobacteria bacterium]|nr:PadR family transcriptional regulator [Deltaproteobacteria bacterium]
MTQNFLLGILATRPLYGYQIKKICDAHFSQLRPLNYGSIYPNLKRLMDKGLVTQTVDPQDNRPNRKVYTITKKGLQEFQKWLHQPAVRPPMIQDEFTLKFLFSHDISHQELLELIDRQVEQVRSWRADLEKKGEEADSDYEISAYAGMVGELFQDIQDACLRWLAYCRKRIAETSEDTASVHTDKTGKATSSIERTSPGRTFE